MPRCKWADESRQAGNRKCPVVVSDEAELTADRTAKRHPDVALENRGRGHSTLASTPVHKYVLRRRPTHLCRRRQPSFFFVLFFGELDKNVSSLVLTILSLHLRFFFPVQLAGFLFL